MVDTVGLARRLLAGRTRRAGLGSLAQFFGTDARPCHRALPDAQATAEILLQLIGLAQERGARTVADLVELAAPRVRKVYAKRSLAFGAPTSPGVYLFRDRHDQVLYVGRARDLRARLRSYFRSDRQRPAVEAALFALERIEWRPTGSEVEAALEELRLLRELRPVANARNTRPDRYVYLRRRGDKLVCSQTPTPLGPIRSRTRARLACRALDGASEEELERRARAGRACARAFVTLRSAGATRTQLVCATASARSNRSSAPFAASSSCATRAAASSFPPPSPVSRGRFSSPADALPPFARSRAAKEPDSKSTQGSPKRTARRRTT